MALPIPMDLFLISAVCITLLIAVIVIMLSDQRRKRKTNAMPLSADDAIWAKVEQRMAAGEMNVTRGAANQLEYEARKADRNKRREATEVLDDAVTIQNEIELIDIFDRMATAFERIADALEAGR